MFKFVPQLVLLLIVNAHVCVADDGCATDVELPELYTSAVLEPPPPGSPTSNISILVAYTPQTAINLTNVSDNIVSYVNWEVGRLNQALTNSGVNAQFTLAGAPLALQQDAPFDAHSLDALSMAFENAYVNGDGVWDEIFSARNSRGADLIVVLYEGGGGKATLSKSPGPSTARDGIAIMGINSTRNVNGATFSHEVGHLMGLFHDVNNGGTVNSGVHPFSLGYRFTGTNSVLYRTIMAYTPGDLYLGFSNPAISYQGTATGVDNQFNEAYTVSSTAPIVAAYSNVQLCDPNRSLGIYLKKESDSALISVYLNDRNGDGTANSQTTFSTWQFSGASWVRQGSGTVTTSNNYVSFGSPNTTMHIKAYPDSYVASNTLTVPNLSNIAISVSSVGNIITGQASISGSAVDIRGNWMDIMFRTTSNGTPTKLTSVPVNSAGVFSYTATQNGYYNAEVLTHGKASNQLSLTSVSTPTPTPTATPTPTQTSVPTSTPVPTSQPTTAPTIAPTATPTPTPTPTPTATFPLPQPSPTLSPTSSPNVYDLRIFVKALTKTKAQFGGVLASNGLPQKNEIIIINCNRKSIGRVRTNSDGRFEKWVNRDSHSKKCQAKFTSKDSNFVKIPKKL